MLRTRMEYYGQTLGKRKGKNKWGENLEKNREFMCRIEEIAAEKGCSPTQLALAWVPGQGKDIVLIP